MSIGKGFKRPSISNDPAAVYAIAQVLSLTPQCSEGLASGSSTTEIPIASG